MLTLTVAAANWVYVTSGSALVLDLHRLFCALQTGDTEWMKHGWLYVMLLTTLLPTLLHFIVAAFVMILVVRSLFFGR